MKIHHSLVQLLESDLVRVLSEASTTHVEAVLADQTVVVAADSAVLERVIIRWAFVSTRTRTYQWREPGPNLRGCENQMFWCPMVNLKVRELQAMRRLSSRRNRRKKGERDRKESGTAAAVATRSATRCRLHEIRGCPQRTYKQVDIDPINCGDASTSPLQKNVNAHLLFPKNINK